MPFQTNLNKDDETSTLDAAELDFLKKAERRDKNRKIRELILSMYNDHVKYPQLRLPKMQADNLIRLMELTK